MANPRKPAQLKAIEGTARADRDYQSGVAMPVCDGVPEAPDWLPSTHARDEWHRLAPVLHKLGLLTEGAVMPLAHMCALHGKLVQMWAAGMEPQASLVQQYRSLAGEFGLTPVAATKVRAAAAEKPANKFSRNGKR